MKLELLDVGRASRRSLEVASSEEEDSEEEDFGGEGSDSWGKVTRS